MQLNPQAFNALIDNMGESFLWRMAFSCPCVNPLSGSPKPGCLQCNGKGRIWNNPIECTAGVCSSSTQLNWTKMGRAETGDLVLIIAENSALYAVGQFDRVTAKTSTDPFSLPLVRGAPTERIFGPVQVFTRVFWLDASSAIVEGGLPVQAADGTLSWPNGGAPPAGTTYSISGSRYTEYFCFGAYSSDRMKHHGARLPRKMVMRRFDLYGRD